MVTAASAPGGVTVSKDVMSGKAVATQHCFRIDFPPTGQAERINTPASDHAAEQVAFDSRSLTLFVYGVSERAKLLENQAGCRFARSAKRLPLSILNNCSTN